MRAAHLSSRHVRSVILTEASERSLRATTSDSFAPAKPVPVPSLRHPIFSVILTVASEARYAQRPRTASRSEAGTGSKFLIQLSPPPHIFSVPPSFTGKGSGVRFRSYSSSQTVASKARPIRHPDHSERTLAMRKDLGQVRAAKPVPVPSLLIHKIRHPMTEAINPLAAKITSAREASPNPQASPMNPRQRAP